MPWVVGLAARLDVRRNSDTPGDCDKAWSRRSRACTSSPSSLTTENAASAADGGSRGMTISTADTLGAGSSIIIFVARSLSFALDRKAKSTLSARLALGSSAPQVPSQPLLDDGYLPSSEKANNTLTGIEPTPEAPLKPENT
jgi:hypothetical protein